MDTRIPHFDGRDDFGKFVRFLDNRKEFDRYVALLDKKIAAFMEAVSLYGKAKDIEGLHVEAKARVNDADTAFAAREKALNMAETEFDSAKAEKTVELAERATAIQNDQTKRCMQAREDAVEGREFAIDEREAEAATMKLDAERAQEAAVGAKQAADDMVARMQTAVGGV